MRKRGRKQNKMLNFKDIIRQDAKQVFLNPSEFGENHIINGKSMTIIIDNNEMIEREKKYKNGEGLHRQQMLFYAAASEFGKLPANGRILEIDGHKYIITDAVKEGAVYSISAEVHGT